MPQTIVDLNEREDRVLTIIKGKYGLKTKSAAIKFTIDKFEQELLEPELRPEYVQKLEGIKKTGKFKAYKSIAELRNEIEHA